MSTIDITPYLTAPNVSVAGGVALGVAVLTAMPEGSPAPVVRAGKALRDRTVALQQAWRATHAADSSSADRPAADHRVDIAWNALFNRLASYAELPADTYPKARKAAAIQASIFDDGLRFLTLPYAREWAESDRHLGLVEDKKTEPELRALAGDDFVEEVKRAHKEYGVALGITEAQAVTDEVGGVQQPLRDLQAALRDYALQVVAAGNDDRSFTGSARAALAPIDELRAAQGRNASAPADAPPPDAGAPAPPAPPAGAQPVPAPASPLPPVTPTSPVPPVPGA